MYKRDENKWYQFDSVNTCNDLVDSVNKYLSEYIPDFVMVNCTQQNNWCDCGPFVGLFAKTVVENVKDGIPLAPCWVDRGLIPDICENMKKRCACIVTEHLMKEEGIKKMEKENSSLDVRKYTNNLRKTLQENSRKHEEKLRDINKVNEANNVVGEEAMDITPSVTSASLGGSVPPVVSAAVATAAAVNSMEVPDAGLSVPTASGSPITTGCAALTMANADAASVIAVAGSPPAQADGTSLGPAPVPVLGAATSGAAVAGSTPAQADGTSLGPAPVPVPGAAASGAAIASSGTGRVLATAHSVEMGTAGGSGDTEVCRYHKY